MIQQPKSKKCKICLEPFTPRNTLQKTCFNISCALEQGRLDKDKNADRLQRAKVTNERKAVIARKDRLKTRRDYMADAQKAFNAYIRARALRFGHSCISSGRPLVAEGVGGGFDCGHFRSTGSASHLRFNLNNAWGQSKHDNQYKSGNVSEYRKGLIERIGLDKVERLEADNTPRKFDVEYLQRITKIFRKKKRMMDKRINYNN